MKKAHINCVSVGIFSCARLEPSEGDYDFYRLEKIINHLYENGIYTILATPSGSKPYWMSERYEEIRRCDDKGVRQKSGARHNHCMTSPVYRKFVRKIDLALAKRFANNPAADLPHGVTAHKRTGDSENYIFVENYSGKPQTISLKKEYRSIDGKLWNKIELNNYDSVVLCE